MEDSLKTITNSPMAVNPDYVKFLEEERTVALDNVLLNVPEYDRMTKHKGIDNLILVIETTFALATIIMEFAKKGSVWKVLLSLVLSWGTVKKLIAMVPIYQSALPYLLEEIKDLDTAEAIRLVEVFIAGLKVLLIKPS